MKNNRKIKKVVISASVSRKLPINKWIQFWEKRRCRVIDYPIRIRKKDFYTIWPKVHKKFYRSLAMADIHFIANTDQYIGVGVFAELAFSIGLNLSRKKEIEILLERLPDVKSVYYSDIMLWINQGWIKLISVPQSL